MMHQAVRNLEMMGSAVSRDASYSVVVADNDAERRRQIASIVREFRPAAVILETASGLELVDVIVDTEPKLCFVGLNLDDLSGPEAVALARRKGAVLPCLILVASRVFKQWQEIAQSLGAYEVLKLPLDGQHIGCIIQANDRRQEPMAVLVASAAQSGRSVIARVLSKSGFNLKVDETDSGRHGLKLLATGDYGLALIDVNLPDLDGIEMVCQLQTKRLSIQTILLTATDPEPIGYAARYFGVDYVLKMPFASRDIELTLHHAYGLRRPYLLNAMNAATAPTALLRIADLPMRRATA